MAKRFFDTELFNKAWFRKLKPKYKTFWLYALSSCNIAGVLEIDFEASEFLIGEKINQAEVEEIFKDQFIRLDEKRYFIKDFVEFQNGTTLKPSIPAHRKIISILEKYRLFDRVHSRVDTTHIVVVEVLVEDKVEVEERVVVAVKDINVDFDFFWNDYDKKVGDKEKIKKKWESLSDQDREDIMTYIPLYKQAQPDKQYRKNPDTFLNNKSWKDEIITSNGKQSNTSQSRQADASQLGSAALEYLARIENRNNASGG